jgi:hypothetical protein
MRFLIIFWLLYFFPTFNALFMKKRNAAAIIALNFLLGWTVIGWIFCLIWSMTKDPQPVNVVQQLGVMAAARQPNNFCTRCGRELSYFERSTGMAWCSVCAPVEKSLFSQQ